MENQKFIDNMAEKYNLLYITDEILVEDNAPTIHILEVCSKLNEFGFNVKLIAPSLSRLKIENILVKYIYTIRKIRSLTFHPFLALYLIYELLRQKKPIIYIRYFPLLILPILLSKLFRVICVLEVNGIIEEEAKESKKNFLSKVYKILGSINMRASTKIIVVAYGIKKYIVKTYNINPKKIFVIENGVNLNKFKAISKKEAKQITKLDYNIFYLGYVGSFYDYQGINYILESAKIVFSKFKNTKLIIVGNGPEDKRKNILNNINQLGISNRVTMLGPIDHSEVSNYINSFDICLCYPSSFRDNATSPFKLFEYLALEKPVICSNIIGLKSYFKDSIVFVPPHDSKLLAEKIIHLIKNDNFREKLGKKGSRFILEEHTWEKVVGKINVILLNEIKTIREKNCAALDASYI